jgi:hypothetical protein
MINLLIVAILTIFFTGCTKTIETVNVIKVKPKSKISNMILKVPVNFEDEWYKNLETRVITKDEDLKKFIAEVKSSSGWDKRDNFLEVIEKSEVDFSVDNLLIYSFKESNKKTVTAVNVPISENDNILVKIGVEEIKDDKPKEEKMVYYALVYKVKKGAKSLIFDNGENRVTVMNMEKR